MSDKNGGNPRLDRVERLIEGLGKAHEQFKREMAEHRAETDRDTRINRLNLRRWAALGVKEARSQRRRQREIDLNITRLSAAQLMTEEKLNNFISSLGKGGNGNGRKSK
jgi:hypothetical protein